MRSSAVTIRPLSLIRVPSRYPILSGHARRVVVVGSANVDLVWHGDRLPAPGETVTDGEFVAGARGQGREPGRGRGRARAPTVLFVGCVGDDEHGRSTRADLEARGIDCSRARDHGRRADGRRARSRSTRAARTRSRSRRARTASSAADGGRGVIRAGDVVLCSLEIPVETVEAAVAAADAVGAPPIVNPAPPRAAPAGALLTPNEHECERLGGVERLLAIAPGGHRDARARRARCCTAPAALRSSKPAFAGRRRRHHRRRRRVQRRAGVGAGEGELAIETGVATRVRGRRARDPCGRRARRRSPTAAEVYAAR